MLIGQTLMSPTVAYTAWDDARSAAATFVCDVTTVENATLFDIIVQTKARGAPDSSATAAGTLNDLGTGVTKQRVTGIGELYRLKLDVSGGQESDEKLVHFALCPPIWEGSGPPPPHPFSLASVAPAVLGRTLVRASSAVSYHGPWFAPGGQAGVFAIEVFALPTDVTFTVDLEQKDQDQLDSEVASPTNGTIAFTTSGAQVKDTYATAIHRQLLRYKFTLSGSASVGHVHFRDLLPSWVR
jgi:hypothetical protein